MPAPILIADDDPHIRDIVSFALQKADMTPLEACNGAEALHLAETEKPALIVLDINMPETDGLHVCRTLRHSSDIPIIFLSSRDEEIDRILGLELGGDDYVTKPFSPRELVARIKTVLKRTQDKSPAAAAEKATAPIAHHKLYIDKESRVLTYADSPVELTAREFDLLFALAARPTKVFDRAALLDAAYAANMHVSDRTIDSHIRHIRQKFAAHGCLLIIETVRGVGYRVGPCR